MEEQRHKSQGEQRISQTVSRSPKGTYADERHARQDEGDLRPFNDAALPAPRTEHKQVADHHKGNGGNK